MLIFHLSVCFDFFFPVRHTGGKNSFDFVVEVAFRQAWSESSLRIISDCDCSSNVCAVAKILA